MRQGPCISRIIVVNDGSTDETTSLLAELQSKDPRIQYINLPHNVGQLPALSIGFRYVDTEFFAFAAADDYLLPGWAEACSNALQSAPGAGLCLSRTFMVNEASGNITKSAIPWTLRGKTLKPDDFLQSLLRYGNWFSSNTVLYRRKTFDESIFEFPSAGAFYDGLTISMLGLKNGVTDVDAPLGVFLVRQSSISGATAAPKIGVQLLNELSAILLRVDRPPIRSRKLVSRMIRRNTYIYIIGAVAEVTSQYAQFAINHLPNIISTALRISLGLGLVLYKISIFISLRPFDLLQAGRRASVSATLNERHDLSEYRKALNNSLSS